MDLLAFLLVGLVGIGMTATGTDMTSVMNEGEAVASQAEGDLGSGGATATDPTAPADSEASAGVPGDGAAVAMGGPWAVDPATLTAAETVRPLLDAMRQGWVAVESDGATLNFVNLVSLRCGLDRIGYAINGDAEKTLFTEPCHEGEANPNEIQAENILATVTAADTVHSVTVHLVYDDGGEDSVTYQTSN